MEIDILTGSILIGLFLMNVILIFLDSHQRKVFRQTEKRLRDALLKKIEEVEKALLSTEKHRQDTLLKKIEEIKQHQMQLQRTLLNATARRQNALIEKIEEVNLLQCRQQSTLQQTEIRLRDALLKKIKEVEHLLKRHHKSTLFDYQSPWWQDYSWLYRYMQDWRCEECQLSLNLDRQYLHTHHISGAMHNDPNDLRALCIACHSQQPGLNHHRLTATEDYHDFIEEYGEQWRLLKDAPPLVS